MINQKIVLLLGFIIGIAVFVFLFVTKEELIRKLDEYNILPKPESFTELYFDDHLKLSKAFIIDEPYSFKFTVHNLENKDFIYSYVVTAIASDSASLLDKGQFTLKHNQSKTIKENFVIRLRHEKVKFNVSLTNKKQNIHFYTENLYK